MAKLNIANLTACINTRLAGDVHRSVRFRAMLEETFAKCMAECGGDVVAALALVRKARGKDFFYKNACNAVEFELRGVESQARAMAKAA